MIDTDDVVSSGCGTLRSRILGVCFTPIRYDIPQGQESKMQASIRISLLLAVTVLLALGQDLHAQTPPARTALDDYIASPKAQMMTAAMWTSSELHTRGLGRHIQSLSQVRAPK